MAKDAEKSKESRRLGKKDLTVAKTMLTAARARLPHNIGRSQEELQRELDKEIKDAGLWYHLSFGGKYPLILALLCHQSDYAVYQETRGFIADLRSSERRAATMETVLESNI
jgi:hypothetical protein